MSTTQVVDKPGKRERIKAENRTAILAAARAVFGEIGYEAATVRDVIRRTNLASGTFYNYFRSKEELFNALASEYVERFHPILAKVREDSTSLEDYIRGAYLAYFSYVAEEHQTEIHVDVNNSPSAAIVRADPPEVRIVFEQIRQDVEDMLNEDAKKSVDLDYLAGAAVGVGREVGLLMMEREPADVAGAAKFAAEFFLDGLQSARSG